MASGFVRNFVHGEQINSFAPFSGETLPDGTFCNFKGFLICVSQVVPESMFDNSFFDQEVEHLRIHVVIVSFLDKNPNLHGGCLQEL